MLDGVNKPHQRNKPVQAPFKKLSIISRYNLWPTFQLTAKHNVETKRRRQNVRKEI